MARKDSPEKKVAAEQAVPAPAKAPPDNLALLDDVRLTMTVELGRARDNLGTIREYGRVK